MPSLILAAALAQSVASIDDWKIRAIDDGATCVAARHYEIGGKPVELDLMRGATSDDSYSLSVKFDSGDIETRRPEDRNAAPTTLIPGDPALTFLPSGVRVFALRFDKSESGYSYRFEGKSFGAFVAADRMSVDAGNGASFDVRLGSVETAIAGLEQCRAGQLRVWGVNESGLAIVPWETLRGWFSGLKYPSKAKPTRAQGRVVILAVADRAGRMASCRILSSSKSPDLDLASCEAVRRKGVLAASVDREKRSLVITINWVWSD